MLFRSIIGKLWAAILVLLILVFLPLSLGLFQVVENFYYSQITDNLVYEGEKIIDLYLEDRNIFFENDQMNHISEIIDAHVLILNQQGIIQTCDTTIHMFPGSLFAEKDLSSIFDGDTVVKKGYHHHFDNEMITIGLPVKEDGLVKEALFIYTPIAPFSAKLSSLNKLVFWAFLGAIFLASIMAFLLSRYLSRPLIEMNKVALGLAEGKFDKRVAVNSSDEIGVLGASLNYLSKELNQNISALSFEKDRMVRILSGMSDGVITFNKEGIITHFNPQAKELLEGCHDVQENESLEQCQYLSQLNTLYRTVLETKKFIQGDITVGEKIIAVRLTPLEDIDTGNLIGVIAVLQDITKERELETMRKEFVANVSHELRTPISLIQGYSEAIADNIAEDPEQKKQFLEVISDEAKRLQRMVEDLLQLSRLQSGTVSLQKETVEMEQIVDKIKTRFDSIFKEKEIAFSSEIHPLANSIWADRFKFEQIITNLISNAVNYTNKGSIKIITRRKEKEVEIHISDTGIGILEQDLPYIFERFYRAEKSRNRETGGTGLGLAIVKNLVEAHEGSIEVKSRIGAGSEFIIRLPG